MRTTIDLPDALYRKTKAIAALRGDTVKAVVTRALEREVAEASAPKKEQRRLRLPIVRSWKGPKIDLAGFDFDDLLG
jgi:Arc/MetJ family transcription regulator